MSKKIFSTIFLTLALGIIFPAMVFASTTDGTIDSTYKYAWSENLGWINFGTSEGNVHVTDAGLSGYAWNENTGWINLAVSGSIYVANNAEGTLSGYAWGEGIGYIDFSGVTIDSDGYFHGYASSTLSGRINFNCSDLSTCGTADFRTKTDWRKASVRSASSGGSSTTYLGGGSPGSFGQVSLPIVAPTITNTINSKPAVNTVNALLDTSLRIGDSGSKVTTLQTFLNGQGFVVALKGEGAPGKEGRYFGTLTKNALIKFQQGSKDTAVIGEKGLLGPKTLAYIAKIQQKTSVIIPPVAPQKSVPAICAPYLLKYIKLGAKNDAVEVKKAQRFLSLYEGFTDLKVTGVYTKTDFDAVVAFQTKYSDSILGPWTTTKPTGYIYKTTLKKINELYCGYVKNI